MKNITASVLKMIADRHHRPCVIARLFFALILIFIFAARLCAQQPFLTDDADTTPAGKFHFEFYNEHDILQRSLYPARRQNTANFKLNYGLTKRLELDFDAPLLQIYNARTSPLGNPFGFGDTNFGVKYNFRSERETSRLPAMTAVFYLEVPTGNTRKQLGSGLADYDLYFVAQKSLTKRTMLRTNAGIVFSGNNSTGLVGVTAVRGRVFTGSSSLTHDFTPKLKLGVELYGALTKKLELGKGQLTTLIGGKYALKNNFSLDFSLLGGRAIGSPRIGAGLGCSVDF